MEAIVSTAQKVYNNEIQEIESSLQSSQWKVHRRDLARTRIAAISDTLAQCYGRLDFTIQRYRRCNHWRLASGKVEAKAIRKQNARHKDLMDAVKPASAMRCSEQEHHECAGFACCIPVTRTIAVEIPARWYAEHSEDVGF